MNRFNWISFSAIGSTIIWGLSLSLMPGVQSLQQTEQRTLIAQFANSKSAFGEFFRIPPPRRSGGGRDGEICTIAPLSRNMLEQGLVNEFLSDRPTFVWRGSAKRIEIRSVRTEALIWGTNLTGKEEWATFNAPNAKLSSKERYNLILVGTDGKSSEMSFTIAGAERNQVRQQLKQQANQIPLNRRTPGAVALKQATYLGKQKLWLDAYGILFSVQQQKLTAGERQDWVTSLQKLRESVCPEPKEKK